MIDLSTEIKMYGAIHIDPNGKIRGSSISSGLDCIVLSEYVIAVDANNPETVTLLQDYGLGQKYYWNFTSRAMELRPTQSSTLDKTTMLANGVDVIHITGAPSGTFTATNTNTGESVSGSISGSDTFFTTVAGTIKIKIEAFPYVDFEAIVEAI